MSPTYKKLAGDYRGFFRRYTLWNGGDHLLLVDSTRFSETYKRFYLRDIQTIIVRKTPRFELPYYWAVLFLAALVSLLIGWFPFQPLLVWPAAVAIAGAAIYLYVASMFQSCRCHLVTRVNKVELPSLFRLRAAQQFVKVLTPQILAVQGELPADWVERSTTLEELSTAADRNPNMPVDLLPSGQFSWLTVAVFVSVLIDAAVTWSELRSNDAGSWSRLNMINMLALAVCATVAIVRLSRQKNVRSLRMLVLAGLFAVAGATYGAMMLQSMDEQFYHQTFKNVLLYPGMKPLAIAEIVAGVAIALPGLLLAFRQTQPTRPPNASFMDGGVTRE